tara:strand:+ start:2967 stop:6452 length:3486 start_codon:yes stop_codon:yes gene_type:complete
VGTKPNLELIEAKYQTRLVLIAKKIPPMCRIITPHEIRDMFSSSISPRISVGYIPGHFLFANMKRRAEEDNKGMVSFTRTPADVRQWEKESSPIMTWAQTYLESIQFSIKILADNLQDPRIKTWQNGFPLRLDSNVVDQVIRWSISPSQKFTSLACALTAEVREHSAVFSQWNNNYMEILLDKAGFPPIIPDPDGDVDCCLLLCMIAYRMRANSGPASHRGEMSLLMLVFYNHLQNTLCTSRNIEEFRHAMTSYIDVAPVGYAQCAGRTLTRAGESLFVVQQKYSSVGQFKNQYWTPDGGITKIGWYTGNVHTEPSTIWKYGFLPFFLNPGIDWSIAFESTCETHPAILWTRLDDKSAVMIKDLLTGMLFSVQITLIMQNTDTLVGFTIAQQRYPHDAVSIVPGYAVNMDESCMKMEVLQLIMARRPTGLSWLYPITAGMIDLHGSDSTASDEWAGLAEDLIRISDSTSIFHPNIMVNTFISLIWTMYMQTGIMCRTGASGGLNNSLADMPVWTCPQMYFSTMPLQRLWLVECLCAIPDVDRWDRAGQAIFHKDKEDIKLSMPQQTLSTFLLPRCGMGLWMQHVQKSNMGPLTINNILLGECFPISGWSTSILSPRGEKARKRSAAAVSPGNYVEYTNKVLLDRRCSVNLTITRSSLPLVHVPLSVIKLCTSVLVYYPESESTMFRIVPTISHFVRFDDPTYVYLDVDLITFIMVVMNKMSYYDIPGQKTPSSMVERSRYVAIPASIFNYAPYNPVKLNWADIPLETCIRMRTPAINRFLVVPCRILQQAKSQALVLSGYVYRNILVAVASSVTQEHVHLLRTKFGDKLLGNGVSALTQLTLLVPEKETISPAIKIPIIRIGASSVDIEGVSRIITSPSCDNFVEYGCAAVTPNTALCAWFVSVHTILRTICGTPRIEEQVQERAAIDRRILLSNKQLYSEQLTTEKGCLIGMDVPGLILADVFMHPLFVQSNHIFFAQDCPKGTCIAMLGGFQWNSAVYGGKPEATFTFGCLSITHYMGTTTKYPSSIDGMTYLHTIRRAPNPFSPFSVLLSLLNGRIALMSVDDIPAGTEVMLPYTCDAIDPVVTVDLTTKIVIWWAIPEVDCIYIGPTSLLLQTTQFLCDASCELLPKHTNAFVCTQRCGVFPQIGEPVVCYNRHQCL